MLCATSCWLLPDIASTTVNELFNRPDERISTLQVATPLLSGTVEEGTSVGRAAAEPMEGGSVGNDQGTSPMDE